MKEIQAIMKEIKNIQEKSKKDRQRICLYWKIGNLIKEKEEQEIKKIEKAIKEQYPEERFFSVSNLKNMKKFAQENENFEIVKNKLSRLSWTHNLELINKAKDTKAREWYVEQAIEENWSIKTLVKQIKNNSYQRTRKQQKTNNFEKTLTSNQSNLANQIMKETYSFQFLEEDKKISEKQLEKKLLENFPNFLLELGKGFSFVGEQYKINANGVNYYIDLLFYNIILKAYVVIELKTTEFKPQFIGQLNMYLSLIDEQKKAENNNPTIGLLLCKMKNKMVAEYSLKNIGSPIGISQYELKQKLPTQLKEVLPSTNEIQEEIREIMITDYKQIGKNIKKIRESRQYTQEQLAQKLQYSSRFVSQIERGIISMTPEILCKICDELEVLPSQILYKIYKQSEEVPKKSQRKLVTKRNEFRKEIGSTIRKCRSQKQYSQEELSQKMFISGRYISQIERGIAGPRIGTLVRMCQILDITIDDLLCN